MSMTVAMTMAATEVSTWRLIPSLVGFEVGNRGIPKKVDHVGWIEPLRVEQICSWNLAQEEGDIPRNGGRAHSVRGCTLTLHSPLLIKATASRTLERRNSALKLIVFAALNLARLTVEVIKVIDW